MNDNKFIKDIIKQINESLIDKFNVMEVCGTHTASIAKYGIKQLVNSKVNFLSGPGCPVCVTSENYIDIAIKLLEGKNVILATFGDMMKVNGSKDNLLKQKERGRDIRVLYSPLNAISLAEENNEKEIVFLGIGFETTVPLIALAIKICKQKGIKNISFLIGMKRMKPILHYILEESSHNIQGFICPGHVAAVVGADYFKFIADTYNISTVIAGFEDIDIIGAIYFLMKDQNKEKKCFKNLYKRCVTLEGNSKAKKLYDEIFTYCDAEWRGIGNIRKSGFSLKEQYKDYDAIKKFRIDMKKNKDRNSVIFCRCSEIIVGKKSPSQCELFGKACTLEHPIGPCMVSSEGSCSIFYKYKGVK